MSDKIIKHFDKLQKTSKAITENVVPIILKSGTVNQDELASVFIGLGVGMLCSSGNIKLL